MTTACLCFVVNSSLRYAVALQFPQSVIAFLTTFTSISKPELFHWKLCLVSQETAVFTPYVVILITVTAITGVCTWVGHPACALTTDSCSTPVRHLRRITWHPPSVKAVILKQHRLITLVLNKLLTVWGDSGEIRQLRQTGSSIMNVARVTTLSFKSFHQRPALTVVTDDCHANTLPVSHVTVHWEWCQSSKTIGINYIVSADAATVSSDFRTGF